jgi:mRNA interferase MazF
VSKIFTVDKRNLGEKIGALSRQRVRQILDGVRLVIEPRDLDERPQEVAWEKGA